MKPLLPVVGALLLVGFLVTDGCRRRDRGGVPANAAHLRASAPRHSPRALRVAWRMAAGTPGNPLDRLTDWALDGDRLYYACDSEVACVSIRTGRHVWRRPLATSAGTRDDPRPGRDWRLALAGGRVFLSESNLYEPVPPAPYLVQAFDSGTGRPLWRRDAGRRSFGRPCPAGAYLLIATIHGGILGMRASDGAVLWRGQWARHRGGGSTEPWVQVRAEGELAVAMVGGGRLIGFHVADGQPAWELRRPGVSVRDAEDGESQGFALKDGVAYAFPNEADLMAVDVRTGQLRWRRASNGMGNHSPEVTLAGDEVVPVYNPMVALDRATGATRWVQRQSGSVSSTIVNPDETGVEPRPLLKVTGPRMVGEPPARSLSVPWEEKLAALDSDTGRESAVWRLPGGLHLERAAERDGRFIASDDRELFCLEEGAPAPAPATEAARRVAAAALVKELFDWTPCTGPAPTSRSELLSRTRHDEDCLRLIELGRDSVPILMAYERDRLQWPRWHVTARRTLYGYGLDQRIREDGSPISLLVDINDSDAVPELAAWCDGSRNREYRDEVAEALIRFGDRRAGGALFRYSQSDQAEPLLRRSALWLVCRMGDTPDLKQEAVTAALLARFRNPASPSWLRRFAQFELLDGRGEAARKEALAAFRQESTAHPLPSAGAFSVDARRYGVDAFDFASCAMARDERGTWWAAVTTRYLGREPRIWFVQSRDRRRWEKPALAFDLEPFLDSITSGHLTCRQGSLVLDVAGEVWRSRRPHGEPVRLQRVLAVADLYRDSDGDGLTDRLEALIGTDPRNPDTNGNGIPDDRDKNPLFRPHPLTDEEGIYQAAQEGLCQLGRSEPRDPGQWGVFDAVPWRLGREGPPLRLPAPPGSPGIQVLGHPGVVLCHPGIVPSRWAFDDLALGDARFTSPHVHLDGTWNGEPTGRGWYEEPVVDPFAPYAPRAPAPFTFRQFFPYERSADGTRARVGWEDSCEVGRPHTEALDVEVRKIDGQWFPVECRQVASYGGPWWRLAVATPVRPVR